MTPHRLSRLSLLSLLSRHLTLLLILLLITGASCIRDDITDRSLGPGDKAPIFSVTLDDGSLFSTADLHGRHAMIAFFNTECPDCQKELPELQKTYDAIVDAGLPVELVCISRAEPAQSVARYWADRGLTLPYAAENDNAIYRLFAVSVIPRIYIIAPDLTIIRAWTDNPLPTADELLDALPAPGSAPTL